VAAAREAADRMGYPVLLKAVAGGGGRGMRRVEHPAALVAAFEEAQAEAAGAFGNGTLYMEKLVVNGRHVELQVLGDGHETVVLGARECSIQRRHQKLVEETPAPGVPNGALEHATARVREAVSALGYRGAGTIEMLLDQDGELHFMEMNTRLQVEHTVTEEVTGIDLVEWQLRIAAGERLNPSEWESFSGAGHAIQCRINAEDVDAGFKPTPGPIDRLVWPEGEGIRVDSHLAQGDAVSPHYDSMIAKIIATGPDRATALARMEVALGDLVVEGVPTTAPFHLRLLAHPDFRAGRIHTRFVDEHAEALLGTGAAT
jgi:acetyl-CoA carboxylase biotin carboxylase subunit